MNDQPVLHVRLAHTILSRLLEFDRGGASSVSLSTLIDSDREEPLNQAVWRALQGNPVRSGNPVFRGVAYAPPDGYLFGGFTTSRTVSYGSRDEALTALLDILLVSKDEGLTVARAVLEEWNGEDWFPFEEVPC